ncbi:DUF4192 domain-containing protein [Nonomuraea sp. GTA35]|uniref:DUF4192 domain-containing protein n=1 Tax=Nonomuraea sp. GTA35 TaxID=1676746 RepID=UPI0035BFE889
MSTASELTNAITIRKPADAVAIVPYLLGYHPQLSLVVLAIDDARVRGTMRLDLALDAAKMAERIQLLTDVLAGNHIHQALLIGYGNGSLVTPAVDAAMEALREAGISISEALRVDDGRYWSYVCTDATCCPPEGVPFDLSGSAPAAAAVVAGMRVLPDRESLAATLDPPADFDRDSARRAMREVCDQARQACKDSSDWFRDGVQSIVTALDRVQAGEALATETASWLGVHLTAKPVRDMAMTYIRQYGPETHVRLWTEVIRKVPPEFAAAPATLLAFAAMCRRDGSLANIALERALSASSRYTLALLLLEGLRVGLPPSKVFARDWSELANDIIAQVRECPSAAWPLLPQGW